MKLKSRIIKFRAWGRWGDWNEDETERKFIMIDGDSLAFEEYEPLCDLLKDKEDECYFMQYTGFKDWHQGDLIKDERTGVIFEIVWNDEYMGWWCVSRDKTIEHPLNELKKYCKVIGNIYEYPNILK